MSKQQEPPGNLGTNHLLWIIAVGAKVARVFVNGGMGVEALGMEGFLAFISIVMIASLIRCDAMIQFWFVWTVMAILRRITASKHERSNYVGNPPLAFLLGHNIARRAEPLIVLLISYKLADWSVPVAKLVGFSAFCIAFQNAMCRQVERRRQIAIRDAEFDARFYQ